jgi:hypothetical protein
MNKWTVFVFLFVLSTSILHAASMDPSAEKVLRDKLKVGLVSKDKDPQNKYVFHTEDLAILKFEVVSILPLDLPSKADWKVEPQTVDYLLKKSAKKSSPQKVIFVKRGGKVVGFLTSEKSSYIDPKLGMEIQKIYDTVGDPARIVWVYFNAGNFGKWLTFNVKDFQGENLTLVDNSGQSPPGYYYDLLSLKKVIERAYDLQ